MTLVAAVPGITGEAVLLPHDSLGAQLQSSIMVSPFTGVG
ncbi:hypothetical protein PRUB_b0325 [Pseudoalteromonas rubra]|uniref:Uncharacterized protein n=1 Tax=Pseudoalteromonas rubra TaxID=43658 RepID=A0A8T0BYQ8_9GAMM|nr:hypothetical protein PRUB_b0325 [Pseudoalteromonas rubra]